MALVQRNDRYYNSTESRNNVTRTSRSSKSAFYQKSTEFAQDSNNNFSSSRAVESVSYSNKSNSATSSKKRSSIPIRKNESSPTRSVLDSPKKVNESSGFKPTASNEDEEATPKVQRKVKKRSVRKNKRRNNAVVGLNDEYTNKNDRNYRKNSGSLSPDELGGSSDSEEEFLEKENPEVNGRSPTISIKSQQPKITVGKAKPIQITYKPTTKTENSPNNREEEVSEDEQPKNRRRNRQERAKTLPVTLVVKRPAFEQNGAKNSESSEEEDTLTSGGEESESEQKRTSIRIVSSAKSTDTEEPSRKLQIDAKSTKRVVNKEEQRSESDNYTKAQREKASRADEIYSKKTRKLIQREPWNQVNEERLAAKELKQADSLPENKFRTLPRNFKTVRVPIQTQHVSPSKEGRKPTPKSLRPKSLNLNARRKSADSYTRSDDYSDKERSLSTTSVQSHDPSPTTPSGVHQCRRGCTHVVEDTEDGPRIVRRSRDKRRQSNPNQILGRTDINESRRSRPKSEIIRSLSLPRSAGRPRIQSTGFEEFVEISDLAVLNRNKSRTLPHKKKRVTYHEDTKDKQAFSETEVLNEDFQRHLEIHNSFTNTQRQPSPTRETIQFAGERKQSSAENKREERAKEIRRQSTEKRIDQETSSIGFKNQQKVHNQKGQRSIEDQNQKRSGVRVQEDGQIESQEVRVESSKGSVSSDGSISSERQRKRESKNNKLEKVKEQVIEEHITARRKSQEKRVQIVENNKQETDVTVQRSQSLPRNTSKQEYLDQKQKEFDEFIRNQRNYLLSQLEERESKLVEVKGQKVKNHEQKDVVEEEAIRVEKAKTESKGRRIEEFLSYPEASKNKRRHKSSNDVESIRRAKDNHAQQQAVSESSQVRRQSSEVRSESLQVRRESSQARSDSSQVKSEGSNENSEFLLQNQEQAKVIEKRSPVEKEDIIRVFSRGEIIQLSMETIDREKFEQRQREYEELQKRRSLQQQQQRVIEDDRYRYINNEFDKRNAYYYTQQQYDPNMSPSYNERYRNGYNYEMNDDVFEERMDTNTTQITQIKRDQIEGKLDKVHYTICTHYFFPEDHELIVNLHRLGRIEVPRGLSHDDTCIFYNHLYVYENEEVYAETLAPITPTIRTEVVNLDEQLPDDETLSENSSANQSYNDDTSSQYSSSSRRDRNLYSSLKAQKYYESKRNNNNGNSQDFGFDSTYETLRRKRKSYTDDEDWAGNRSASPGSGSSKSDFTYSKPRLLRRSDHFPGVGKEVEDDYPRWKPKSPTRPEREYGLSVALPP